MKILSYSMAALKDNLQLKTNQANHMSIFNQKKYLKIWKRRYEFKLSTAKKIKNAFELHKTSSTQIYWMVWKSSYKTLLQNKTSCKFYIRRTLYKHFGKWEIFTSNSISKILVHYDRLERMNQYYLKSTILHMIGLCRRKSVS